MTKQPEYDDDLENLLKGEAEKAESLSILHRLSHEKYNRYSNAINIPVIVGSSAIGFATGVKIEYEDINIVLGIFSVIIGCIKALDSYFQLAQRSERHRIVSLQYAQICRKIAVELALERNVRLEAKEALNMIRTDIKNLEEIAPIIPDDVIDIYKAKYPKKDGENVKRPNITNGLTEIVINKPNLPLSSGVGASANLTVSADILPKNVVKNHGVEIIDIDGMM